MSTSVVDPHHLVETWLFFSGGGFLVNLTSLQIKRYSSVMSITNGPDNNRSACRIVLSERSKINDAYFFHHSILALTFMSRSWSAYQPHGFQAVITGANISSTVTHRKFFNLIQ